MGSRQVSAGGVLIHEEERRITHDHGNRLVMRGRIALDTVHQLLRHARHERAVLLGLRSPSWLAGGLGHGPTPVKRIACITSYRKEGSRGAGVHQGECV